VRHAPKPAQENDEETNHMDRRTFAALALAASLCPWTAVAQPAYPTKTVKFIVPYAPGGLPDTVARVVAKHLGERLGQGVVIDNRPGGNGVVAYQNLLQSNPSDGHTFIVSDGSMLSITPQLNKAANYQVGKDILPVSLVARSPLFIVAHPSTGVNTLQDLIELARQRPGELTYGSSGIGSTHHLTMEALKAALNLDIRHVPFRGSGQSTPALVGGQVHVSVAALPSIAGFVKNNQVKILASNALTRSPHAPDIPTVAETIPGHPGRRRYAPVRDRAHQPRSGRGGAHARGRTDLCHGHDRRRRRRPRGVRPGNRARKRADGARRQSRRPQGRVSGATVPGRRPGGWI
jgi:tripartite-type tricarboxylate transporter receptor subunit TctC